MPSVREPDVGDFSSNRQDEGLVHAIETLEMSSGQWPNVGDSLSSHQAEGPVHAFEMLEMSLGRRPIVGGSPSSPQGEGPVRSEVGFIPVGLGEVPSRLVVSSDLTARGLLQWNRLRPLFLYFTPSLGEWLAELRSIFNLNILLDASENVPHLGDLVFHQMLVEGMGDLQSTDERGGSHFVITVIHQGYLALEITDIVFEALSELHLSCEKVVVVLLELL